MTKATKTPEQSPEMAQMLEMMASMKATMDANSAELTALKAQKETIKTPSEMAQRREECSAHMLELVHEEMNKLRVAFGYDFNPGEDTSKTPTIFTTKVVEQAMWALANTHAKQYFWSRKGGDTARLKLFKLSDKYNHQRNRRNNTDGVDNDSLYEQGMSPHKDYERAEQNVDYYAAEELPNQVLSIASRNIWDEIVEDRRADHRLSQAPTPFREPNEPYFEATDGAYIEWLENDASKREIEMLKGSEAALETARLAYYARTLDTKVNTPAPTE
jgi:hypothetical protein